MNAARSWLPRNALSDGALEAALIQCGDRWSSRWLRSTRPISGRTVRSAASTKLPSDAMTLASADAAFCFSIDKAWLVKLAIAALGLKGSRKLAPLDLAFLETFGAEAASDLANEASSIFGAERAARSAVLSTPNNAFHFSLSMGAAAPVFNCYASEDLAVFARKRLVVGANMPTPLDKQARALEHQPVTLGARVGGSRLPLSTATALAIGDVIVLDRPRSEPAEVTVNGAKRDGALWRWRDAEVRFELERTSPS